MCFGGDFSSLTLYSWVRVIYAFHAMSRGHFHFPDRDSGWERKLPSCPSLPGTLTPNPGPCPPNLPFYTLIAYKVSRSVGRRLNRGCPSPGQPDVGGLCPPGLDLLSCRRLLGALGPCTQWAVTVMATRCRSCHTSGHGPLLLGPPRLSSPLFALVPFSASRTPGNVFPSRYRALKAQSMVIRTAASSLGSGHGSWGQMCSPYLSGVRLPNW